MVNTTSLCPYKSTDAYYDIKQYNFNFKLSLYRKICIGYLLWMGGRVGWFLQQKSVTSSPKLLKKNGIISHIFANFILILHYSPLLPYFLPFLMGQEGYLFRIVPFASSPRYVAVYFIHCWFNCDLKSTQHSFFSNITFIYITTVNTLFPDKIFQKTSILLKSV